MLCLNYFEEIIGQLRDTCTFLISRTVWKLFLGPKKSTQIEFSTLSLCNPLPRSKSGKVWVGPPARLPGACLPACLPALAGPSTESFNFSRLFASTSHKVSQVHLILAARCFKICIIPISLSFLDMKIFLADPFGYTWQKGKLVRQRQSPPLSPSPFKVTSIQKKVPFFSSLLHSSFLKADRRAELFAHPSL